MCLISQVNDIAIFQLPAAWGRFRSPGPVPCPSDGDWLARMMCDRPALLRHLLRSVTGLGKLLLSCTLDCPLQKRRSLEEAEEEEEEEEVHLCKISSR